MAKASGGSKYAPLSPKPARTPMSPRLFTNMLGQALARQGLDATLAPAIVADLAALTPPGANVPDTFDIHGIKLCWPQGREARVLYPDELRVLNRALARNGNSLITEDDAIVRVARGCYETLWAKRNQPDYVANLPGARDDSRVALSDTLSDALGSTDATPEIPAEHAHEWERSPGSAQDRCTVVGCTVTQEGPTSAVAGLTGESLTGESKRKRAKPKSDVHPNPEPTKTPAIEHVVSGNAQLDLALARLEATVAAKTGGESK